VIGRAKHDLLAGVAIVGITVLVGSLLRAWSGFPKGTDAAAHLTRLKFVADWFPSQNWLYAWAAGMPTFGTYPPLPYLIGLAPTRLVGAEATLIAFALVGMVAFVIGLYAFVTLATGSRLAAFGAVVCVACSMAIWTWIVHDGLYARIVACGFGAWAWYAHEHWRLSGSRTWFVTAAILLAATVASHAFMGLVFAGVVVLRTLSRPIALAPLAGLALLIGAPAWLPAFASGTGSRFFGVAHGPQVHSPIDVLWRPDHVGLALPIFLALALVASAALRLRPPVLFLLLSALAVLYVFAPSIGLPDSLYYVNGVDPFTVTFFVTLFGACAAAFAFAPVHARLRPAVGVVATIVVLLAAAGGAVSGGATLLAGGGYPEVYDATSPGEGPSESMRTLHLPDDLEHRVMPNSADESVWISYRSRMPQLRDYYSQGQVHPDWLALAYTTMYDPPYDAASARALLDWFAVSIVTVETTSDFRRNIPAMTASGDFRVSAAEGRYARLDVEHPAPLVAASDLPLTVVAGNEELYRMVTRLLLRSGVPSARAVPVWWPGQLSALDGATLARTGVLVAGATDEGNEGKAAEVMRAVARAGGRVVVDLTGWRTTGPLADLLPVTGVARMDFPSGWGLRGDVDVAKFAPATYEGGGWAAEAGTGLASGARAVLSFGDHPVVAERTEGAGKIVALGGNLLFHADYTRNLPERSLLVPLLVPAATPGSEHALTGSFRDPEHRVISVEAGATVLFKESWTPAWQAELRSGDETRALRVLEAGPGLMAVVVPQGGTLRLTHGAQPSDLVAWLLFAIGVAASFLTLVRRPR
jgi:hypothetical protein